MTATNKRYLANQSAGLKFENAILVWSLEEIAQILGKDYDTVRRYKWEGIPKLFQGALMARKEYKKWVKQMEREGRIV